MSKKYTVTEVYDANEKNIEEKLQEVFITFLTEKITNNLEKSIDTGYNPNSWIGGTNCYRKGET